MPGFHSSGMLSMGECKVKVDRECFIVAVNGQMDIPE